MVFYSRSDEKVVTYFIIYNTFIIVNAIALIAFARVESSFAIFQLTLFTATNFQLYK